MSLVVFEASTMYVRYFSKKHPSSATGADDVGQTNALVAPLSSSVVFSKPPKACYKSHNFPGYKGFYFVSYNPHLKISASFSSTWSVKLLIPLYIF